MIYSTKIKWLLNLAEYETVDKIFSTKTLKKIKATIKKLNENGYYFKKENLNEFFLNEFLPLYTQNILSKSNPSIKDVRGTTLEKIEGNYKTIGLYDKQNALIGGLIYNDKGVKFAAAYKVFPLEFILNTATSLTMTCEYIFYDFAKKNGCLEIIHGKDNNLYGLNSSIGLALFKLQLGCIPHVSNAKDCEIIKEPFVWDGSKDVLIFEGSEKGEKIKKAKLFISNNNLLNYTTKYSILLNHQSLSTEIVFGE